MRRFSVGLSWGFVLGVFLSWLYCRYFRRAPRTLVTRPYPVEEKPPEEVPPEEAPPDDFTALRGIGPVFAGRLQRAGVRTFAQLGRLSPEEVARRCKAPLWRVLRYDWVGQAAARSL